MSGAYNNSVGWLRGFVNVRTTRFPAHVAAAAPNPYINPLDPVRV